VAGHSKWANIKHKKARVDAKKGKIFTKLSKDIILAAKLGGGDPAANPRLKTAVEKARAANIPNENIKRAIMKATGQLASVGAEELVYEGYGPGGVAVMLDIVTDNRNRTAGEIRHLFSKYGGSLGESGCVSWMFDKKGFLCLSKEDVDISEDDLLAVVLEVGAEDMKVEEDSYEIYTQPENLDTALRELESKGIRVSSAEIMMIPKTTVKLSGEEAEKMMKLLDALEEHNDVNEVYSNFESMSY